MKQHVWNARRWVALLFGALAWLCLIVTEAQADFPKPTIRERQITLTVGSYLEQGHLSRQGIDDDLSKIVFQTFLKQFDPNKMYFTAADIEEFQQYETLLDDFVRAGNLDAPYRIVERYLERLEQRTALVLELLEQPFDYTVDETMITDEELVSYPKTEEEVQDRWRKRVKYELLLQKINGVEQAKAIETLTKRYRNNARILMQTDNDEILEWFLGALARSFDPHTDYLSHTSLEEFNIHMRLQLDGIGAELRAEDEYTIVVRTLPGGAADEDGRLKPGDKITGVGQGEDGEFEPVIGMRLTNVVKLIRGKPGSVVRLEILTENDERRVYALTRRTIQIKDYGARSDVIEHGKKPDGTPYRIGVIGLDSFYVDSDAAAKGEEDYASTTRDVRRILEEFKKQHVDAVMLDLRKNGGGFLMEAISLTGLFIRQGTVVQVKDYQGEVQSLDDLDDELAYAGPLVVLVSKMSASASEIFAAAIQDYGRGVIVGDNSTHGKGTVQNLLDLAAPRRLPASSWGALKLTMQKFYRVNGESTQERGVHPDIVLPSLRNHAELGESHLPRALKFDKVGSAEHDHFNLVTDTMRAQLQNLSEARRAKSKEFTELAEEIDSFVERKNRKEVPLEEAKLRAMLNRDKSSGEDGPEKDEDEQDAKARETPPVFDRESFYNQEVLSVTEDYLRLAQQLGLGAVRRSAN